MKNANKLIPLVWLAAMLSFLPQSIAASPEPPNRTLKPAKALESSKGAVEPTKALEPKGALEPAKALEPTVGALEPAKALEPTKGALDPGIQELMQKGFVIFIPKGTRVPVVFDTSLSSDKSRPGDEFSISTGQDILLEKSVLVPKGAVIKGTVLDGQALLPQSSKLVTLQLRFDSLNSPAYGKINTAGGKLFVKGDAIAFVRGGKKLFLQSLFVTTPYRPQPPPDCNAFKTDKGKKIEIAAGDKFDFEFSSDVRVSPR